MYAIDPPKPPQLIGMAYMAVPWSVWVWLLNSAQQSNSAWRRVGRDALQVICPMPCWKSCGWPGEESKWHAVACMRIGGGQ